MVLGQQMKVHCGAFQLKSFVIQSFRWLIQSLLTVLITSLRRRSWVAEPEIAIGQIALINSDL